ncbi:MAG: uroporphyrinogen decarboxylase family protein [Lentisphaeria bacterium]|jgi:uroporphyrinogen decarboxylase|nr:uroporphyrinogen decarboxylase family protein [Lentisphaeria bacterium]
MTTMTSQERVLAAIRRQPVDRVPVVEFLIDPRVAAKAVPGCLDPADCMDRLGMDAVACGAKFQQVEERGPEFWVDEWGVLYQRGPEALDHPIQGPIATWDDLRRYNPPDPAAPHRLGALPDLVRRYKGRRAILFHQRAAFMWSAYLHGIDTLLMDLLLEPEFTCALMDMVLETNLALVRRAIRAGAEVIVLGDDYASNHGPMMSPALFEAMILPRLKKMVDTIHEEGALAVKHSDGNLYPILESIASSGADGLNPIEPIAGMDLKTTKARVGDRMALIGNIDCGHLLPFGTAEDVRQAVRQAIADAAPGGGFLISSSNSIHSSCKPENLVAMVQAAHEFGGVAAEGVQP